MKKVFKWIGIIVIIFIVLIIIAGAISNKKGDVNKAWQQGTDQAKQDLGVSPDQKIKDAVTAAVNKDIIKDIQVTKQTDGGYGVLVSTKAEDGFSNDTVKKAIWMDNSRIYTALYKDNLSVNEAAIVTYGSTTDKYGKVNESVVMKTSLEKSEAAKVNWDQNQATLDLNVLPNVWKVEEVNPALQ